VGSEAGQARRLHSSLVSVMKLETALGLVGVGWEPIVRKYFAMVELLQQATDDEIEVVEVGHRIGMIEFKALTGDHIMQDVLNRVSWTFERDSARICEVCGGKGFRRKSLPGSPNRCRQHYLELANELAEHGEI